MVTLGLSKVTRQAAQRRRNLVEDGVLVSCTAKPCHLDGYISPSKDVTQPLTLTLSRKGRGDGYLGAMRSAYCTLPLTRRERGWLPWTITLRYSTQFDSIRPESTLPIAPSVPRAWGHGQEAGWSPLKLLPPLTVATRLRR